MWLAPEFYRVYRGGSWGLGPRYAWVANRDADTPGICDGELGLRLVRRVS